MAFAFVAGSVQHAAAQDADEEEEAIETKFMKSLFGLDQPTIEYRERSPLVVPPSTDLPPPQTNTAINNPAWPKDADSQPKKKKTAARRKDWDEEARPLTPYELERGSRRGAGLTPTDSTQAERGAPISPDELGYKGGIFGALFKGGKEQDDVATFTGEPPRTSLTAPPAGYQTPSPNQPYGLSAKKEAPKPYKLENRGIDNP